MFLRLGDTSSLKLLKVKYSVLVGIGEHKKLQSTSTSYLPPVYCKGEGKKDFIYPSGTGGWNGGAHKSLLGSLKGEAPTMPSYVFPTDLESCSPSVSLLKAPLRRCSPSVSLLETLGHCYKSIPRTTRSLLLGPQRLQQ